MMSDHTLCLRRSILDSYNTFNEILVTLFNDIMDIEEKAVITEDFKDITNNDMHVIEAIGLNLSLIHI